jgi:hypothetical protein
MEHNWSNQPTIITNRSNSVPLPVGYRTDLPDNDPINHNIYTLFHNKVGQVLQSNDLYPVAKIVMIAYLMHGEDASDTTIRKSCGITIDQLYDAQMHLMKTRWFKD